MTDFNTAARSIIANARSAANQDDKLWSSARVAIFNLFDAFPGRAFRADQTTKLVNALEMGFIFEEQRIQSELSKLVREKVLRSRTERGVRLYEIAVNG